MNIICNNCNQSLKESKSRNTAFTCGCDNYLIIEKGQIVNFDISLGDNRFRFSKAYSSYYPKLRVDVATAVYHRSLNFDILPIIKDNVLQTKEFIKRLRSLLILS